MASLREVLEADADDESGYESSSGPSGHHNDHTSSSFNTSTPNKDSTQTSESSTLAKAETRAVNRSKMVVFAVLAVAALGVGIATYWFSHESETREFENKFHDFAIEMEELVHDEARDVFLTVATFATTITSYSIATKATWPFVSVPHFEIRGMELNQLSSALMVSFSPIVTSEAREKWEIYANYKQGWIQEGVEYNEELHRDYQDDVEHVQDIYPVIYDNLNNRTPDLGTGPWLPVWQQSPAPYDPHVIHYNLLRNEVFERVFHGMTETLEPVLSEATDLEFFYGGSVRDDVDHPHSFLLQPVMQDFNKTHHNASHLMGVVIAILPWDHYFENILPPEAHGIVVVMEDTCGDVFSYQINGAEAVFLGYGDFHDPHYAELEEKTLFAPFQRLNFSGTYQHCEYDIHIYPSSELESDYRTAKPILYAVLVVGVFFVTAMVFVTYDFLVQRRQDKVMLAAKKSNAVVASLFPKNVRDRIMEDVEEQMKANGGKSISKSLRLGAMPRSELKNFLDDGVANSADGSVFDTKPIADLFLSTTIMFGDIAGFTAWSSVREPSQVFTLLETLYHSFDEIAKRRRVFKVETIGDCYVAVSGLPEPRKDHASVMARFARDCITSMNDLTKKLEISLGPDTGDLSLRVGLHSGPVTAGVLRGDKSRFQLFGDTVNTAARMEAHGVSNRIHASKETADLLKMSGKGHWVVPRNDKIQAKGKGFLETFFLDIKKQSSGSHTSGKSGTSSEGSAQLNVPHLEPICGHAPTDATIPAHLKRKIQWNADILLRMLRQIVARRNAEKQLGLDTSTTSVGTIPGGHDSGDLEGSTRPEHKTVLDEVKEIIVLPEFNAEAGKLEEDPSKIKLPDVVVNQMREYVTVIASLYHHDNPFHNFEHASHVTMSVVKLLSRIVAPEDVIKDQCDDVVDQRLHDYTFGITSCPLTQFAVAFSALIHDVDHQGIPNTQLVKEKFDIAAIYRNQSVAEQNSVDLAWALLMEDNFKDLRKIICATDEERKRFRQLVINVVLATDICDAELKKLRNGRWARAFSGEEPSTPNEVTAAVNRKATIVLEHLIQASDVAHTMQHWHIYRKWNECFFEENMKAYRTGRSEKDPTEYWYEGELGFFDYYIIPLAKKLKECGVFGVSSDEYLNYAISNRREWEAHGKEVVAQMSAKYLPPLVEDDLEDFEDEDLQ